MKAKKIDIIKNYLEFELVCNIEVFLSFANFYRQFIQGFNKIVALLTLMLKTIELPDVSAPSKNDGNKPAFGKNDNTIKVRFDGDDVEYAKKSRKLKSQKLVKSQKLSKSRKSNSKKSSKNRNLIFFKYYGSQIKLFNS